MDFSVDELVTIFGSQIPSGIQVSKASFRPHKLRKKNRVRLYYYLKKENSRIKQKDKFVDQSEDLNQDFRNGILNSLSVACFSQE